MQSLPFIVYCLSIAVGAIVTIVTLVRGANGDPSTREAFCADLEKIGLPPSKEPKRIRPQRRSAGMTIFLFFFCLFLTGVALYQPTPGYYGNAGIAVVGFWTLGPIGIVGLFDLKRGWTIDGPEGLLINNWQNQLVCFRYDELTSYRASYQNSVVSWTHSDERNCYLTWTDKTTGKMHSLQLNLVNHDYENLFNHLEEGEFRGQFYTEKDRTLPYEERLANSTRNYRGLTDGFYSYKNHPPARLVALVPPTPA